MADEAAHSAHGSKLEVVVVSPARPIFDGEANWVTVPAWDRVGGTRGGGGLYGGGKSPGPERLAVGQLGILPGHAAIVAALGSGLLRIGAEGGKVVRFAVRGGFVKVGGSKVTVLVDHAVTEADVDATEARSELDDTLVALRHPKTDEEFTELLDRRAWCESRLKLAGAAPSAGH